MSRFTDLTLIAQVVTLGSHRAFGQLVERHQQPVRRFLLRLTAGDAMLADDLAQETFIRAWQGLNSFRGTANLQTWLTSIAYRVFLDEQRKRRTFNDTPVEELNNCPQQDEDSGSKGTKIDIDTALATLSEAERTCVILQCIEGHSIKEIAAITDMNENTVKSHLARGKNNLAGFLRKNGYR